MVTTRKKDYLTFVKPNQDDVTVARFRPKFKTIDP